MDVDLYDAVVTWQARARAFGERLDAAIERNRNRDAPSEADLLMAEAEAAVLRDEGDALTRDLIALLSQVPPWLKDEVRALVGDEVYRHVERIH